MAVMIRTALRINEAGQALFRMLVTMGPKAFETADLLARFQYDITRAALMYGLQRKCEGCAAEDEAESIRGCNACVAAMRQRVHRLQERLETLLGGATPTMRHRKGRVVFGADRDMGEELNWYQRAESVNQGGTSPEGPGGQEL